jgi:chemotaxis signal transduction protein
MSGSIFDRPLPEGYRDEMQARIADPPAALPARTGSILLFQIGDIRLALPTRVASAVAPVLHIARIPHRSGTVLLGLAAFRGEILPCCSLARILEIPQSGESTDAATARTLILEETPTRRWAAPIDGVLGVRTATGEAADVVAPIGSAWIENSFEDHTGAFHLLDSEVLFRQIALATA